MEFNRKLNQHFKCYVCDDINAVHVIFLEIYLNQIKCDIIQEVKNIRCYENLKKKQLNFSCMKAPSIWPTSMAGLRL